MVVAVASLLPLLVLPVGAFASPPSHAGRFLFRGTSITSGDSAFGVGVLGATNSVRGFGTVRTADRENAVFFSFESLTFCSGGPSGVPCLGLQGTVTTIVGNSINGAKVGDSVVAILVETSDHAGSTCIIIPALALGGACDDFEGAVMIP